jgi:tRNA-specific 2-thiouridylase
MGFDAMATGHYVRLAHDEDGKHQLLTGCDPSKDQSYVLHMLGQAHLSHLLFPVGEYLKGDIREMAAEFGLPVAAKPDSQDICFLIDNDYRRFLGQVAPESMQPGPILDLEGRSLGTHHGLPAYTIGQRKGLGISAPAPLYVLKIDPERNALIVGDKDAAGRRELTTVDTRWVAGSPPENNASFQAEVRIRYRSRPHRALVTPMAEGETLLRFEQALPDISPGQAAVFYQGEVCLGGGTITRQESSR